VDRVRCCVKVDTNTDTAWRRTYICVIGLYASDIAFSDRWELRLKQLCVCGAEHAHRSVADAVSLWPLTTEARVRSKVSPCDICHGQSGNGTGFPRVLRRFSLVSLMPPMLHIYFHVHVALTGRTSGRSVGALKQSSLFSILHGIGDSPFKAQWLLYVPPGLTFTNSTFCPHSVFMCFVWISEQTAIISLYSIN
jgi:hypothetical protein